MTRTLSSSPGMPPSGAQQHSLPSAGSHEVRSESPALSCWPASSLTEHLLYARCCAALACHALVVASASPNAGDAAASHPGRSVRRGDAHGSGGEPLSAAQYESILSHVRTRNLT